MSFFERYLTLWVAICIVAGIALGQVFPAFFQLVGGLEIASVNLPVAVLIWLMVIPMLLKIDFSSLGQVAKHWRGVGVTLFINWGVKPFSMALLGYVFLSVLFRPYLPADQIDSYIAGLIILAAAPCTAMVFVWSNLSDGEPNFTLSQVALNDAIMIVAFAPIVAFLLGLSSITVPWETLILSVALYIIVPVIIALIAVPILIQVYFNSGLAYLLNRATGEAHCVAGPSALIGASNFFELAVATAISLFGFTSGAALATVVGVLIEVPVMLSVVKIVNASRGWYDRGAAVQRVQAHAAHNNQTTSERT